MVLVRVQAYRHTHSVHIHMYVRKATHLHMHMNTHTQYRGLGFLCVEVVEWVQGTVGLYSRDGMRGRHMGTEGQTVGDRTSGHRGHLGTATTTTV